MNPEVSHTQPFELAGHGELLFSLASAQHSRQSVLPALSKITLWFWGQSKMDVSKGTFGEDYEQQQNRLSKALFLLWCSPYSENMWCKRYTNKIAFRHSRDEERRYQGEAARFVTWRLGMVQMAMHSEIKALSRWNSWVLYKSLWMEDGWDYAGQSSCWSFSVLQAQIGELWCSPASGFWAASHSSVKLTASNWCGWLGEEGAWQHACMDFKFNSGAFHFWETPCGMWVFIFSCF